MSQNQGDVIRAKSLGIDLDGYSPRIPFDQRAADAMIEKHRQEYARLSAAVDELRLHNRDIRLERDRARHSCWWLIVLWSVTVTPFVIVDLIRFVGWVTSR